MKVLIEKCQSYFIALNLSYFIKNRKEFAKIFHSILLNSYLLPFQRRRALLSILSSSRSRATRLHFHGYILRRSEKGVDTPSCDLCTFDNMRLGRFYNARPTHGIFQIMERRGVRAMR